MRTKRFYMRLFRKVPFSYSTAAILRLSLHQFLRTDRRKVTHAPSSGYLYQSGFRTAKGGTFPHLYAFAGVPGLSLFERLALRWSLRRWFFFLTSCSPIHLSLSCSPISRCCDQDIIARLGREERKRDGERAGVPIGEKLGRKIVNSGRWATRGDDNEVVIPVQ